MTGTRCSVYGEEFMLTPWAPCHNAATRLCAATTTWAYICTKFSELVHFVITVENPKCCCSSVSEKNGSEFKTSNMVSKVSCLHDLHHSGDVQSRKCSICQGLLLCCYLLRKAFKGTLHIGLRRLQLLVLCATMFQRHRHYLH